jgi:hypothetical protein
VGGQLIGSETLDVEVFQLLTVNLPKVAAFVVDPEMFVLQTAPCADGHCRSPDEGRGFRARVPSSRYASPSSV